MPDDRHPLEPLLWADSLLAAWHIAEKALDVITAWETRGVARVEKMDVDVKRILEAT